MAWHIQFREKMCVALQKFTAKCTYKLASSAKIPQINSFTHDDMFWVNKGKNPGAQGHVLCHKTLKYSLEIKISSEIASNII